MTFLNFYLRKGFLRSGKAEAHIYRKLNIEICASISYIYYQFVCEMVWENFAKFMVWKIFEVFRGKLMRRISSEMRSLETNNNCFHYFKLFCVNGFGNIFDEKACGKIKAFLLFVQKKNRAADGNEIMKIRLNGLWTGGRALCVYNTKQSVVLYVCLFKLPRTLSREKSIVYSYIYGQTRTQTILNAIIVWISHFGIPDLYIERARRSFVRPRIFHTGGMWVLYTYIFFNTIR